ncbi:MAG TPA: hypothetical protein VFT76_02070 [Actinomycetota bacterium]|nr:hypothetical protein [Actinomycetota bacterium]
MNERAIEQIRSSRDRAAERALDSLEALEREVAKAREAIGAAQNGLPVRTTDFVPNTQYLAQVVEYGAAFEALWYATGFAEGEDAR